MNKVATVTKRSPRKGGIGISPGESVVADMSPPLAGCRFIYISESTVMGRPETFAFPCAEDGTVTDWLEMDISQTGALSWRKVLEDAGYAIEESE